MIGGIRSTHARPQHTLKGPHQKAAGRRVVHWRTSAVVVLFSLSIGLLCYRTVSLMVIPDPKLEKRIACQYESQVVLHPKRGTVQDRKGRELAVSVTLDSIFADPALVDDPTATAVALAPVLGMDRADLETLLGKDRRFVWLRRQVDPAVSQQVQDLDLDGIRATPEAKRRYPNGEFASQLIGFVGLDGNGLEGLEARYDEILMGEKETYVSLRDGLRRNITPQGVVVRRSTEGHSIRLTIDRQIQYIAEEALARCVELYRPAGAFVLVMEPRSGDLLAIANAPSFDPNDFSRVDRSCYRNRGISDTFEPGSTMKPFMVAAALDLGLVTPETEFDCERGAYRIGRNTIHDTHDYDDMTVDEIMKVSSNIGSAKIAEKVGAERLHEAYVRYGFGRSTGIDLAGESAGILRGWRSWKRIGLATHAFGQGISVTGIQIAAALSAVANGGTLHQPRIIAEVRDRGGQLVDAREPVVVDRCFDESVAAEVRRMMGLVVEEGGTGTRARLERYSCGGKTGTAQKVNSQTGRYDRTMWVSSFVGFAPLEDPDVVVVVVVDEPKGKHYGGTVAGPVFKEVASRTLQYMGVTPLPEPIEPVDEGEALAEESGGAGEASQVQDGAAEDDVVGDAMADEGAELALSVDELTDDLDGQAAMPDLSGLTMRAAFAVLAEHEVAFQIEGSGFLVEQTPLAGAPLMEGDRVLLTFGGTP
jgi:cell division protein FtsI (penicillin-binding protein 3)